MITPAYQRARLRGSQIVAIAHSGGLTELRQRAARRAYQRLGASVLDFPLRGHDIADSGAISWSHCDVTVSQPLSIAWIMSPPAPGSGGHTTIFRMVEALEHAGHQCVVHLYDRDQSVAAQHAETIRRCWPNVTARVVMVEHLLPPADVYIATSWPSAHVLARRGVHPGARLYFVQDYEPYFYPRGTEYTLAADTYEFGFRTIALGGLVAETVGIYHDCAATRIPFGTDNATYRLTNHDGPRSGVSFFARPGVSRRGYELGIAALVEFHRLRPDQPIHLFGSSHVEPPIPATIHGRLTATDLARLYNKTVAGLVLSFTNISLVPYEMMACGVIPIMNDDSYARTELAAPAARWSAPRPTDLANALVKAIDEANTVTATTAAGQVAGSEWSATQHAFVRAVEAEAYGLASDPDAQTVRSHP
jgi:hypothetical protein